MPQQGEAPHQHEAGGAPEVDLVGSAISPGNSGHPPDRQLVDPRLAFMLRAACKFYLVEAGLVELDEAFADLAHACRMLDPCTCAHAILDSFERHDLKVRQERLRKWRWRS